MNLRAVPGLRLVAAALLIKKGIWHLIPECIQKVEELKINLFRCIFYFLGPTRHVRRHQQSFSKGSPWRPEGWPNPGEAPSQAQDLPGNDFPHQERRDGGD